MSLYKPAGTLAERQERATEAWITSVEFHGRFEGRTRAQAEAFVRDMLANGRDTEVRDLVTLKFKPHHITYSWNEGRGGHWCPGYHDCLACYPD